MFNKLVEKVIKKLSSMDGITLNGLIVPSSGLTLSDKDMTAESYIEYIKSLELRIDKLEHEIYKMEFKLGEGRR